jgi:hypothetical protein
MEAKKEEIRKDIVEKQTPLYSEESVMKHANISIILEDYNDIFSDFDPRPYTERAISDDFLFECKKAFIDKNEFELELRLFIPKEKREIQSELKIKKRLKNHFQKHFLEKENDIKKTVREGLTFAVIGFILMMGGAAMAFFKILSGTFWASALLIILEPAGWFFFWEGLAKALFIHEEARNKRLDLDFYRKMAKTQIYFLGY